MQHKHYSLNVSHPIAEIDNAVDLGSSFFAKLFHFKILVLSQLTMGSFRFADVLLMNICMHLPVTSLLGDKAIKRRLHPCQFHVLTCQAQQTYGINHRNLPVHDLGFVLPL